MSLIDDKKLLQNKAKKQNSSKNKFFVAKIKQKNKILQCNAKVLENINVIKKQQFKSITINEANDCLMRICYNLFNEKFANQIGDANAQNGPPDAALKRWDKRILFKSLKDSISKD